MAHTCCSKTLNMFGHLENTLIKSEHAVRTPPEHVLRDADNDRSTPKSWAAAVWCHNELHVDWSRKGCSG